MFRATQNIYNELLKVKGLKVFTDEHDNCSEVWLQFGVKNGGSYRILFISNDDDNDVAVRVFGLVEVAKEKIDHVLPVLNDLNHRFRFLKFVCDSDGDINVEYDYPVISRPEDSAMELVSRVANIIEEAYPKIMQAIWS